MKKTILAAALGVLVITSAGAQESTERTQQTKQDLSTLWTALTVNMITADVLGLYIPEAMDEWEKFADGNEKEIMLAGAVMYQIPVSMIFLSRMLPYKANRWANIISAGLMTAAVIAGGSPEPHYIAIATAEVATMGFIAWKAARWKNLTEESRHSLRLKTRPESGSCGLSYSYSF